MKKRLNISWLDFALIKVSIVLSTLWLLGIVFSITLSNNALGVIKIVQFLVEWNWAIFALALIIGIKPVWIAIYGRKSAEGDVKSKEKSNLKKKTTNKKKVKKK